MKTKRIGIALIIVGIAGAAILALLGGMSENRSVATFGRANVGCRTFFQFDKPGTYYIFVETGGLRVIDQGCPPKASADELVLSLLYSDSRPVPLVPDASVGYTYDGSSAVSTSRFDIETSGRFELVAVGPNVEQVVALGADPAAARRPWWFASGMILTIGLLGGLVLLMSDRLMGSSTEPVPDVATPKPKARPGLPAGPIVRPAPAQRSASPGAEATTGQVRQVGARAGAQTGAKPIAPVVPVSDTPTGQSRPLSKPVVSSGSTVGAAERDGRGSSRRRRSRSADAAEAVLAAETVGDALDADAAPDGPGRRGRGSSGGRPADRSDSARDNGTWDDDEWDHDGWDDDIATDDYWYDDFGDDSGEIATDVGLVGTVDDDFDEVAPSPRRRPATRSRRRPPGRDQRRAVREEFVGDYLDDIIEYADDDDYARGYGDERLDDRFTDYSDRYPSQQSWGDVDPYLDDYPRDEDAEPARPRRRRTSRPAQSRQNVDGQRPPRRRGESGPGGRRRSPSDSVYRDDGADDDRDRFVAGRLLPEQRRTQPRRRRTPPPPPPPGDEWEELPPPVSSGSTRGERRSSDDPVVSDEWTSDGDDTGAWRWWSPPDPGDRTQR